MKKHKAHERNGIRTKDGHMSGLEDNIVKDLKAKGVAYEYEQKKIRWELNRKKLYTPDIEILKNGIIIEAKGLFTSADRVKHLEVKKQHPELDIRFVFSNSRAKLSKKSATTYGAWATKHGFLYADKLIPESWINE